MNPSMEPLRCGGCRHTGHAGALRDVHLRESITMAAAHGAGHTRKAPRIVGTTADCWASGKTQPPTIPRLLLFFNRQVAC